MQHSIIHMASRGVRQQPGRLISAEVSYPQKEQTNGFDYVYSLLLDTMYDGVLHEIINYYSTRVSFVHLYNSHSRAVAAVLRLLRYASTIIRRNISQAELGFLNRLKPTKRQ